MVKDCLCSVHSAVPASFPLVGTMPVFMVVYLETSIDGRVCVDEPQDNQSHPPVLVSIQN